MTSQSPNRPVAFVLVNTNHGTMIVNRFDYRMVSENAGFGVGFQLLNTSSYDHPEVALTLELLKSRRSDYGNGVVAIDCGANIGVHTIEWARSMSGWGRVYSFEPQEKIYYALAGNLALNNCFNVTARHAAVGAKCGTLGLPEVNYCIPSSFGSLELNPSDTSEYIGQSVDYEHRLQHIDLVTIDSLGLTRIDLIKIDVEGMELEVLRGASNSIARFRPQLLVEVIKSDEKAITELLEDAGYSIFPVGLNLLAIHPSDASLERVKAGRAQSETKAK